MDINRQIIELSSEIGSVQEFCSFVNTFYSLTKCTYPQCNIRSFNEILRQGVVFENNTDKESRCFFMQRCIQNPELFQSLYRLKENLHIEEIASLLPLICMENYPIDKCISKVCLLFSYHKNLIKL